MRHCLTRILDKMFYTSGKKAKCSSDKKHINSEFIKINRTCFEDKKMCCGNVLGTQIKFSEMADHYKHSKFIGHEFGRGFRQTYRACAACFLFSKLNVILQ